VVARLVLTASVCASGTQRAAFTGTREELLEGTLGAPAGAASSGRAVHRSSMNVSLETGSNQRGTSVTVALVIPNSSRSVPDV
jgi:hypothetical protein